MTPATGVRAITLTPASTPTLPNGGHERRADVVIITLAQHRPLDLHRCARRVTVRHYFFTLNRLFGRHRQPYVDIIQATGHR